MVKVLVYPHDLGIGGSQLNAIEIAAAVQRQGHETVVFGRPGPLVDRIEELGLEFIESPVPGRRPSLAVTRALLGLIRERDIDIVHGYEWPPALECVLASRMSGASAVATVMSMAVAPFIPKRVPLMVGTEQIAAAERAFGRTTVSLLEPPVDVEANRPGRGRDQVPDSWHTDDGRLIVAMVTRFAHQLKLEGILTAMEAVGRISVGTPMRLVIAGDGPAREDVRARAAEVNARYGEGTVLLVGELSDPRPLYALADVTLGMGGSALRSMAFAKPLVVQGERGFWKLLTPETLDEFLWAGWYGVGDGPEVGVGALEAILHRLSRDSRLRAELGAYGRSTVECRFSVAAAAARQVDLYIDVVSAPGNAVWNGGTDAAALLRYSGYYATKRLRRALGTERTDDFNAKPVVTRAARPSNAWSAS